MSSTSAIAPSDRAGNASHSSGRPPPPPPLAPCGAGLDLQTVHNIARIIEQLNENNDQRAFPKAGVLSDEQRAAARHIRSGRLNMVRLADLGSAKVADRGGAAKPLAAFEHLSNPIGEFRQRVARLISMVSSAHPASATTADSFLNALADKITSAITQGASWDQVTPFYKEMMERASHSATRFLNGHGVAAGPRFALEWLSQESEVRTALENDIAAAISAKAAKEVLATALKGTINRKRDEKDEADRRRNDPKKPKGAPPVARGAGVVAGPKVEMPADKKDPAREKFNKDHPQGMVAKKKKNMPACWAFWHGQGCARGEKCDFFHEQ